MRVDEIWGKFPKAFMINNIIGGRLNMTSELITIENIRGYIAEDGTAFLNAEDVAKGWGFVEKKKNRIVSTSGDNYETVRWSRVNGYLKEFGFSTPVSKDDYLPENIVYRLGFKANNQTAQEFQALLADEVIPSIRKTGQYSINQQIPSYQIDDKIERAKVWIKEQEEHKLKLQAKDKQIEEKDKQIEKMKPDADFAKAVKASKDDISINALAKLIKQACPGRKMGEKILFEILRNNNYLIKSGSDLNLPTQRALNMKLFKINTSTYPDFYGCPRTSRTTKVTPKGQGYFINKFLNNKL